jgi:hypothetical protein
MTCPGLEVIINLILENVRNEQHEKLEPRGEIS